MAKTKNEVSVELRTKADKKGPLTVEDAKEILGWTTEEDAGKEFGTDYALKLDGQKIRFANNPTNRPFRMTLAKRYANEMLRNKWQLNGEAIIIDRKGNIQSAQHRLVALVLAERMRDADKEDAKRYGWRGPVTIEVVIVRGISDRKEVVDTLDIGQKRTLADVIFRNHAFKGVGEKGQKQLARILSGATRLCWLRAGGKTVSDAPHFPHSEALDFVEDHPGLIDSVRFIFEEEGGTGADGKRISSEVSLAYAAGLHFLMSTAGTDPDKYDEGGEYDEGFRPKADDFWVAFASGAGLEKGNPILALKNALRRLDASGAAGRDEIIGTVINAFNLWVDGKKASKVTDVKVKKTKDKKTGKLVIADPPRLGGIDVFREVEEEEDVEEVPAKEDDGPKKGSKSKGGWAVGDQCWVKEDDGEHWFGKIVDVIQHPEESGGGTTYEVRADLDGKDYDAKASQLVINEPKD